MITRAIVCPDRDPTSRSCGQRVVIIRTVNGAYKFWVGHDGFPLIERLPEEYANALDPQGRQQQDEEGKKPED